MRIAIVILLAASAHAEDLEPPTSLYEPAPKNDPPRWRLRSSLLQGIGDGIGGVRAVSFPTTLEFGARFWGPLSVSVAGVGIVSSRETSVCGSAERPNAALGTLGLRADLSNTRSASWLDPFLEAHAGVGGQAAFAEAGDPCRGPRTFASGGGRIGFDAWFGRVALTAQLSYDYLPREAPLAFSLGGSFVLY